MGNTTYKACQPEIPVKDLTDIEFCKEMVSVITANDEPPVIHDLSDSLFINYVEKFQKTLDDPWIHENIEKTERYQKFREQFGSDNCMYEYLYRMYPFIYKAQEGLFTSKPIQKGTVFKITQIDSIDIDKIMNDNNYHYLMSQTEYQDRDKIKENINIGFVSIDNVLYAKALKDIEPDEELSKYYGEKFWFGVSSEKNERIEQFPDWSTSYYDLLNNTPKTFEEQIKIVTESNTLTVSKVYSDFIHQPTFFLKCFYSLRVIYFMLAQVKFYFVNKKEALKKQILTCKECCWPSRITQLVVNYHLEGGIVDEEMWYQILKNNKKNIKDVPSEQCTDSLLKRLIADNLISDSFLSDFAGFKLTDANKELLIDNVQHTWFRLPLEERTDEMLKRFLSNLKTLNIVCSFPFYRPNMVQFIVDTNDYSSSMDRRYFKFNDEFKNKMRERVNSSGRDERDKQYAIRLIDNVWNTTA